MPFDSSRGAELRPWLLHELPKITDSNPDVLAGYTLLLLRDTDPATTEGRKQLITSLDEFTTEDTAAFVDSLIVQIRAQSLLTTSSNISETTSGATQSKKRTFSGIMQRGGQAPERFPALPHPYRFLFLGLEPASLFLPFFLALIYPSWFQHQLVPSSVPHPSAIGRREMMAVWHLGNCYGLLGLISSFVFRAVRDALNDNPAAQERIVGASLAALAVADVTHILLTLIALPPEIALDPSKWNAMTWGNIPTVVVLFAGRLAWFAGIGRERYLKQKTQ